MKILFWMIFAFIFTFLFDMIEDLIFKPHLIQFKEDLIAGDIVSIIMFFVVLIDVVKDK